MNRLDGTHQLLDYKWGHIKRIRNYFNEHETDQCQKMASEFRCWEMQYKGECNIQRRSWINIAKELEIYKLFPRSNISIEILNYRKRFHKISCSQINSFPFLYFILSYRSQNQFSRVLQEKYIALEVIISRCKDWKSHFSRETKKKNVIIKKKLYFFFSQIFNAKRALKFADILIRSIHTHLVQRESSCSSAPREKGENESQEGR